MDWLALIDPAGERVVLPLQDLRDHDHSSFCWCMPTDQDGVWVHHSLDQREDYENGRKMS